MLQHEAEIKEKELTMFFKDKRVVDKTTGITGSFLEMFKHDLYNSKTYCAVYVDYDGFHFWDSENLDITEIPFEFIKMRMVRDLVKDIAKHALPSLIKSRGYENDIAAAGIEAIEIGEAFAKEFYKSQIKTDENEKNGKHSI